MNDWNQENEGQTNDFFGNLASQNWTYDVPNWNQEFNKRNRDYRFYVQFYKCIFHLLDTKSPQRLRWYAERRELQKDDKDFNREFPELRQWKLVKNQWTFNGYNLWDHLNDYENYDEETIVDVVYSDTSEFYEFRNTLEENNAFSTFRSFSHWFEQTRRNGDKDSESYKLYKDFCLCVEAEIYQLEETLNSVYYKEEPVRYYQRPYLPSKFFPLYAPYYERSQFRDKLSECIFSFLDSDVPYRLRWNARFEELFSSEEDYRYKFDSYERRFELKEDEFIVDECPEFVPKDDKSLIDVVYGYDSDFYQYKALAIDAGYLDVEVEDFSDWFATAIEIEDESDPEYKLADDFRTTVGHEIYSYSLFFELVQKENQITEIFVRPKKYRYRHDFFKGGFETIHKSKEYNERICSGIFRFLDDHTLDHADKYRTRLFCYYPSLSKFYDIKTELKRKGYFATRFCFSAWYQRIKRVVVDNGVEMENELFLDITELSEKEKKRVTHTKILKQIYISNIYEDKDGDVQFEWTKNCSRITRKELFLFLKFNKLCKKAMNSKKFAEEVEDLKYFQEPWIPQVNCDQYLLEDDEDDYGTDEDWFDEDEENDELEEELEGEE